MTALFYAAYLAVIAALAVHAASTLALMLFAWRQDGSMDAISALGPRDAGDGGTGRLSFSLLVPARHETQVLAATLDRLAGMRHDNFEIIVIVGHDDPDTAAVAQQAAERHPQLVRVVVDHHPVKNKPRALNTALPYATGDVVGVFDAEDVVHPALLAAVERRMVFDRCAALQAGVQLMNYWSSWFSVRNVMEYYFWFRSRLHFQASRGFIPLGGNTVFVRRILLDLLGGWDGDCLAEDCDLGVRLSSHGFAVSILYDAALVTREETPADLASFVRQRTRWNQGFLQVLFKRDWTLLPRRRQRALAVYTLCTPFVQAFTGLLLPVAVITALFVKVPDALAVLSIVPLVPVVTMVAVEHLALVEFGRMFGHRPGLRDHARLALGTPAYQAVLAYAALRAVVRHVRGHHGWEKTDHLGLHLPEPASGTVSA